MNALLPRNEHMIDRIVRVVLGVAVLSLVWIGPKTAWGWLGLIPLVTGLIGRCPMYRLFGISTCSTKQSPAPPTSS